MIPNINGFTTTTGITNLTSKDFIDDATIVIIKHKNKLSGSAVLKNGVRLDERTVSCDDGFSNAYEALIKSFMNEIDKMIEFSKMQNSTIQTYPTPRGGIDPSFEVFDTIYTNTPTADINLKSRSSAAPPDAPLYKT